MLNWGNHSNKLLLFPLLILGSCLLGQAGQTTIGCQNYVCEAMRLMRALYPDLIGRDATVQISGFQPLEADGPLNVFSIGLSEVHPTEPIRASPNLSSAERLGHLSMHFEFDPRENRIDHIFSSGSFVSGEKQAALTKLVDGHPEWDEVQMTDALLASGAKFGPNEKDAVLAQLPKKRLEAIIGSIEVGSVEFQFRQNSEPPRYASLEWTIRFRATRAGASNEYFASIEPFGGKVVMFGRALGKRHK